MKKRRDYKEEIRVLIVLIIVAFTIKTSVAEIYVVPTPSMEDTIMVGDMLFGNDHIQIQNAENKLNPILYFILPLLFVKLFNITLLGVTNSQSIIANVLSSDTLFLGWQRSYTNLDLLGIILSSGLLIGGIGTVVGHELVHRKKNSLGFKVSNWLLAITWDPAFGIEHVHGHHKNVATYNDPESARRGEGVYSFIFRSTVGTLKNAWNWESERLAQKGISTISFQNQMIQVYIRSAIITGLISLGGSISIVVYFGSVVWAKILLETVNYLEHYGLVRIPGTVIEPKHSWNSNHRISSYILYILTINFMLNLFMFLNLLLVHKVEYDSNDVVHEV